MKNSIGKPKKSIETATSKSDETIKTITEEDIRRRAYEIYLENGDDQYDELDNWLSAERELLGYYD